MHQNSAFCRLRALLRFTTRLCSLSFQEKELREMWFASSNFELEGSAVLNINMHADGEANRSVSSIPSNCITFLLVSLLPRFVLQVVVYAGYAALLLLFGFSSPENLFIERTFTRFQYAQSSAFCLMHISALVFRPAI